MKPGNIFIVIYKKVKISSVFENAEIKMNSVSLFL